MTLIDSVARFIPGVLGHQASAEEDSSPTDCWTARTIPAQRCWKGWKYRRFCCRATMPRYVAGA